MVPLNSEEIAATAVPAESPAGPRDVDSIALRVSEDYMVLGVDAPLSFNGSLA